MALIASFPILLYWSLVFIVWFSIIGIAFTFAWLAAQGQPPLPKPIRLIQRWVSLGLPCVFLTWLVSLVATIHIERAFHPSIVIDNQSLEIIEFQTPVAVSRFSIDWTREETHGRADKDVKFGIGAGLKLPLVFGVLFLLFTHSRGFQDGLQEAIRRHDAKVVENVPNEEDSI